MKLTEKMTCGKNFEVDMFHLPAFVHTGIIENLKKFDFIWNLGDTVASHGYTPSDESWNSWRISQDYFTDIRVVYLDDEFIVLGTACIDGCTYKIPLHL